MGLVLTKDLRAALSNFAFKLISVPLERVCRLLVVLVAAPALGAAGFGIYQLAVTATGLITLGTDLGLGIWTTRALARNVAPGKLIVGTALTMKSAAVLPTALLLLLASRAQAPGDARRTLLVLGVAAIANTFVDFFAAIFRGYDRVRDDAWVGGLRAVLTTGAALGALRLEPSAVGLAWGVTIGAVASVGVGFSLLQRRYQLVALFQRPSFDRRLALTAVRQALPLWAAGLLSTLYFRCDVLLLGALSGNAELGAYSAAYKIFEAALIFPLAAMAVAFAPLARAFGDHDRQRRLETRLATLLFVAGGILGASLYFMRDLVIRLAFGAQFRHSVASLRVLAVALSVAFANRALTHFLMARDLERRYLVVAAFVLVVNVTTNLIMIPRLGGVGAAWATLVTEVALAGCTLAALRRGPNGGGGVRLDLVP